MTEITLNGGKELGTPAGCEIFYASVVANGYTYTTHFSKINAAFFQQATYGYESPAVVAGAVGLSISGAQITFAISGTVTAGYLQIWGE